MSIAISISGSSSRLHVWSRLQLWLQQAWLPILFVAALFGIWEACVYVFDIQPYMLPAPSTFFYQLFFRFDRIWDYTLASRSPASWSRSRSACRSR